MGGKAGNRRERRGGREGKRRERRGEEKREKWRKRKEREEEEKRGSEGRGPPRTQAGGAGRGGVASHMSDKIWPTIFRRIDWQVNMIPVYHRTRPPQGIITLAPPVPKAQDHHTRPSRRCSHPYYLDEPL